MNNSNTKTAPRAIISPRRIYARAKVNIVIDCKVKSGDLLYTNVKWSKNDISIEPDFDKVEIMVCFKKKRLFKETF